MDERSWIFILNVVHFIASDVQITHQIVFYLLCWIFYWIFSLTNQAPTGISWQRIWTFPVYKQLVPAAWERYLLYSKWAHPAAVIVFSNLWLWRQWQTPKEAEFASSVLSKSSVRTLGRAAESDRKIPTSWLRLADAKIAQLCHALHLRIILPWSRSLIPFLSQVMGFHPCPLWIGLSHLHPALKHGSDFQLR